MKWILPLLLWLEQRLKPKPTPPADPAPGPGPIGDTADQLVAAINAERAKHSLPSLDVDGSLRLAANRHADWMAGNGRLTHTGEGGSDFYERARWAGYPLSRWPRSEIIAGNFRTVASVVAAWMNSAGHSSSILDRRADEVGAAIGYDSDGRHYWCVVFGMRSSESVSHTLSLNPVGPIA